MSEKLKIGFIGAGNIAERHAKALTQIGGVEISHWSPDATKKRAVELGARHDRLSTVIEKSDALFVCGKPNTTFDNVSRVVAASKPVFTEKPLDTDALRPHLLVPEIARLNW